MDLTAYRRLQLTLFIPDPVGSKLDELRRRWDPAMVGRICSHITVLRRVADTDAVLAALCSGEPLPPCRVRLGSIHRAERSHGRGVFVEALDPFGDLSRLRDALVETVHGEPDAMQTHPHVSLAHPRTVAADRLEAAWEDLRHERLNDSFVVTEATLIGETNSRWENVTSVDLAGRH